MLEKSEIKQAIREIMQEDKVFFRDLLYSLIQESADTSIDTAIESGRNEPTICVESGSMNDSILSFLAQQPADIQTEQSRSEKIDAIIRRNFERYHNVFKALA